MITAEQEISSEPSVRFRARTLRELLEDPEILTPPAMVVPYLAWAGRVSMVSGREKCGKSTIIGQAVASLSAGGEFLGVRMERGKTLWLALDEAVADLVQRLDRYGADPDNIMIAEGDIGPLDLEPLYTAFCPDVIVIDCLANWAAGIVDDPGNAMAWGSALLPLTNIARKFDIGVILIHHGRKSDGGYRDSTSIGAQVDMILSLDPSKSSPTRRDINVKGRLRQPGYSVDFQGDHYVLENHNCATNDATPADETRREVLEVLAGADTEGMATTRWEKASGVSSTTFYRLRLKLLAEGLITVIKHRNSKINHLTDKGRELISFGASDPELLF